MESGQDTKVAIAEDKASEHAARLRYAALLNISPNEISDDALSTLIYSASEEHNDNAVTGT